MVPAKGGGDEADRRRSILGEELAVPELVEVIFGEADRIKMIPRREADGLCDAAPSRECLDEEGIRDVGNPPVGVGFGIQGDVEGSKFQRRRL